METSGHRRISTAEIAILFNSSFSELYHANSTISLDNNAAYDNLNRLQSFSRGTLSASGNNGSTGLDQVTTLNSNSDSSETYTLDALGNMTSVTTDGTAQTNSFNSQNEETAGPPNTPAFDNNGNTTGLGTVTLVYDAWNRLVRMHTIFSNVAIFTYDANGNRITNVASSTTTQLYNSSAGQALEERRSGTVVDQYVWGLMGVNQPVLRDDRATSGSLGKSSSGLGRRFYAQQDADSSVTAMVDGSGTVQERFVYSPYGTRTALNASWSGIIDSLQSVYGFQGGRIEPVGGIGGLIHFGVREFSSTLMRWIQPDPAGYIDGGNRYQAMDDSPASKTDPTGLCAEDPQAIRARINDTIQKLQSGNYGVADLQSLANDMRALGKSESDIQMATAAFVSQLSSKINQDTATFQAVNDVVDRLGTRPAQFLTGYFVDAPVGLVSIALHPVQTAENLLNTVAAAIDDPKAVGSAILAQLQDPRGQGAFIGNIAWGWATGKAIAGLIPTSAAANVAVRTFTSDDPLVAELANDIEAAYPGHVVSVNEPLFNAVGEQVTDADILLRNGVIQVKSGQTAQNILRQLQVSEQTTGLPALGYAPNFSNTLLRNLSRMGGFVTNDRAALVAAIAP